MATNGDTVRIGIVGTGGIASAHLKGYRTLADAGYKGFEIAAVCDPDEGRLSAFATGVAELFGAAPAQYRTVEEMAAQARLDAVDICTPHAFHHTTAIPCLEAGLDVMVEKPCGITLKATDLIIEAASRSGRIAAVAEQVRRGIRSRCMKWAINEAKMIGEPRLLSVTGYSHRDFAADRNSYAWQWRLLKQLTGGGMIFDAGAHFADMMYYLFGEVDQVSAWTGTFQSVSVPSSELGTAPMDVEDSWMAILRFRSGLVCNWAWSFSAPGESVSSQILYGSKGSARDRGGWMHTFQNGADVMFADGSRLEYETIEQRYRDQLEAQERERLFPLGVENDMALECFDFIDAVRQRRPPEIDAATTRLTKSLCLAIYESAVTGETVRVEDVTSGKASRYQDPINDYWGI